MSEPESPIKKEDVFLTPEQEAEQLIEKFFMPSVEDRKWTKTKIASAKLHGSDSYKDAVNASIVCVDIILNSITDVFGVHPHIAITGLEKVKQILKDKIK